MLANKYDKIAFLHQEGLLIWIGGDFRVMFNPRNPR